MARPAHAFFAVVSLAAALQRTEPSSAASLADLIDPDAKPVKVAGDLKFTEGPAWSPGGFLLFSDVADDRILKLAADGTTADFLKPSGGANGLTFDRAGVLYACRGGARAVSRIDPASKSVTDVATSSDGKSLARPNDLTLDGHGGVYFTDPGAGRGGGGAPGAVVAIHYTDAAGKTVRVSDSLARPNGVRVSPDGKWLYAADTTKRELVRCAITAPGKIEAGKAIFTGDAEKDGGPDGMAIDEHGNIFAAYNGIVILDPEGALLGRIPVAERPSNCVFGGKDGSTLYITARSSLYMLATKTKGMALQPAGPAAAPAPAAAAAPEGASAKPAEDAKTREVKLKGVTFQFPEGWKQRESTSAMRAAELEIPAAGGDKEAAELVVYYFGAGGAGTRQANVQRWINQFGAEGREAKVYSGKTAAGADYSLVDVKGTYNKPIGGPASGKSEAKTGSRMFAAIVPGPEGDLFLKLTGPEKTVAAAAAGFRKSFGADAAKEKEEKSP